MDWGVISGCTSLVGLICEWKARQEVKLENLEQRFKNSDGKIEAIAVLQSQQNLVLTEIKTRLELLLEGKMRRKKNDG